MSEPKRITLDYFAIFREYRKADSEELATGARDARELYRELKQRYGFPLPLESLRVAVNDEFASWERELEEGDRVTFIAPVAGG